MAVREKLSMWERTKDVASTYTGTFIVVMILNQLLFFGFCLNPICLIAAMPHVLFITVVVGTILNKIGNWGERGNVRKVTKKVDETLNHIGDAFDNSSEQLEKELEKRLAERTKSHNKEKRESRSQSNNETTTSQRKNKTETSFSNEEIHSNVNVYQNDSDTVYVTNSNLSKIVSDIDVKNIDLTNLYKSDLSSILSIPELNLLYVWMESFKDIDGILKKYNKIERVDRKRYVFEGGLPTYHFDKGCPRLSADFKNLEIPPEIKNRGEKEIERFREFCKEHWTELTENEPLFLKKLEAHFMLKNPPKTIAYKNSGVKDFTNLKLRDVEAEIDKLLHDADVFRHRNKETEKIIKDKGYGTHKIKEAKEPGHPLYIWHNEIKIPLKKLLRTYFQVKFNPELKFSGKLLDQLGFKPCATCSGGSRDELKDDEIPF